MMNELLELARVLTNASDELDRLKTGLDTVKKNLDYYLKKINNKKYTDNIYKRVDDGKISPLQALNEAKTTWETKQLADKTQQSDGQHNADIFSNTSDSYGKSSPQSSSEPETKNVGSAPAEVYQGSDWEWQLEQNNMDRSDDSHNNEQPDLRDNATPSPSTSSAQTGAPEVYRGSDWEWQLEQNNMERSDDSLNNEHPDLRDNATPSPSTSSGQTGAPEVYQGSDWEWQLEPNNMDRSDDRRTYENDNLNRNDTSGFSKNSVHTDGELDKNWPENSAKPENSDVNTTNYDQNNNPQSWADNSNYKNINPDLAQYSNESDTGQNENNQQDRKNEEPDITVPSVNFEPNKESDSHGAGSGRRPTLHSQQTNESLNRGSGWERPSAASDGEVISQRKKRLQQEFTQDQQLGTNSRNNTVGPRSDLNNFDTSDGFSPLNSDNQNVNSEYDTNYNTSDIEYSEYSPLNTDDQQETFNSAGSTAVYPSAIKDNKTALNGSSTQINGTSYFNDVEDITSYNDPSPLNSEDRTMETYPNAQSQIQSSDSGSEGFDDEVGSDSATWNQSDEIHAETLNSSQQKSHSPDKNNNFSNSAHGFAAPSVQRNSAHSEPFDRNSDEIRYMERFDTNNFASSDDSSATQNSNTGLEQMHQPGMSSQETQAKPDALDEQSQNYNLNSADNEHSSNQSETNQRLDQSYNSASNQATDTSRPKNTSTETQPDDFHHPDTSSLSRPDSFGSSISQSSSASSDVPTKAPEIHPLDVICNTLEERTKNKEEIITAKALFKKYKMGGKFVRNMIRAFPLPELIQKNPEVAKAVDDLVNYLSDHRNELSKDQKHLKVFFANRHYGSKD